jgi:hypothetical protein
MRQRDADMRRKSDNVRNTSTEWAYRYGGSVGAHIVSMTLGINTSGWLERRHMTASSHGAYRRQSVKSTEALERRSSTVHLARNQPRSIGNGKERRRVR